MKFVVLSAIAALALVPALAGAQTCASPLTAQSNQTYTGNTCTGVAGYNLGGTVLQHPTIVYRFIAQNPSGTVSVTGTNMQVALSLNCSTPPTDGGNSVTVTGLPNGTPYYLFVTADIGIPAANPPVCGAYSMVTQTLPVALQKFSVD